MLDLKQKTEPQKLQKNSARRPFVYLRALRPQQWTKNLIVFAAPLFAFRLTFQSLLQGSLAFLLFCCVSSSFYLLNDVADLSSDRRHPVKRYRPIAAGLIPVPVAIATAIGLLTVSQVIGWYHSSALGLTLVAYALLQVAYNLRLKHVAILDLFAIATGFILRAWAGAVVVGVALSTWFLLCTAMLALFLGIEKRKAELRLLQLSDRKTRSVLKSYSMPLLNRMEGIVTTGAIMSYALWSSGPLLKGASTAWMLSTLPFVLYGIFRYQLLSEPPDTPGDADLETKTTERPEEVLLKDVPIQLTLVGWVLTVAVILLLKNQGLIV
ncbi:MAG: decaprenyl-phosphate phosphoribosyltransferase [Cyanobacteria bacterium P01_A01_bin.17]